MQVFLIIALVAVYCYLIYLFFAYVAPIILVIGSIVLTLLMMGRYFNALGVNLLWGEGWVEEPRGEEPAFHDYFFLKAYQDYKKIVLEAYAKISSDFTAVFGYGKVCMNPYAWFVGIAIWGVTVASAIPASIIVLTLGLIHVSIVLMFVLIATFCAAILQISERTAMAWHHRFISCSECHDKISMPLYICKCSAEHKRLLPGKYGVLSRRCKCGEELPTLFLLGRNRVPAFCPGCRHPLSKDSGVVTNLHFPIVGGTSAGKSSFMTATLVALKAGTGKVKLSFPAAVDQAASRDQRNFERAEGQYLRGEPVDKTADSQVSAFLAKIEDAGKTERLIYSYDAAGEIFRGGHNLASLPYLSYIDGIFFLIDPYSLSGVRTKKIAKTTSTVGSSTSTYSPQDIYDTVMRSLIQHSKRSDLQNVPVAIVITKADMPNVHSSIQACTLPASGVDKEKLSDADVTSLKVKHWLILNGERNLVQSIEQTFKRVRYFECSALGRPPEDNSGTATAFQARGVIPIWSWMLSLYGQKFEGGIS